MTRYRLTVEYDGGPFVGWQRQTTGPSVQAALERAVLNLTGVPAPVIAAGRTDTGVHASGQVVHVEIARELEADRLRMALNHHLKPLPIAVLEAAPAAADFHARFSAKARHYRYRLLNRRAPAALERGRVWWVPAPLDLEAMQAAAALLPGHHDFSSFRAAGCQANSPWRTLERLDLERQGEEIVFSLQARSFLHNQVRIIVGTLRLVGDGRWIASQVGDLLAACDRRLAGPTAPPQGLCLTKVDY
ncbi:MAG: tRNA pseudouridine(38-40) synthase TruA [Rhodospirillales bacterium]